MDRRLFGTDVLALPMTRRDIADYLGLSVETVSRELSRLRVRGILKFTETSQRQIVLKDRQELQALNS
jgi:CRP/FNR family nitrogen fixation transcriptional regulator